MADRDKVINNLSECIEHIREKEFAKIPFWGNCQLAMMDALELLKQYGAERLEWIGAVAKLTAENEMLKQCAARKPLLTTAGWICGCCGHLIAKGNDTLPEKCDVCGTRVGSLI